MNHKRQGEFRALSRDMSMQAIQLVTTTAFETTETFMAMIRSRTSIRNWWEGAFPTDEEIKQLDSAAKIIANRQPCPELPPAQRARLALRLMLASRVLSGLAHADTPPKGW